MTQALAPTDSRLKAFRKELGSQFKGFTALLPRDFPEERFARMALNAVQAVPKLLECDRGTLWLALNNCAALGLEPNTPLHEASIVPRGGRAVFQPEYRAYVKLASNAGVQLQAGTIRRGDKVDYQYGDDGYFHFQPALPWENEKAEAVGYYAYGRTPNGPVFLIWSKRQVEEHRDRYSDAYKFAESGPPPRGGKKDSPWHTAFDRMAEKTMIHQLARWLPKEIQRLARVEEAADAGYQVRAKEGELEIVDAEVAGEVVDAEEVVAEVEKATEPAPDPRLAEAEQHYEKRREEMNRGAAQRAIEQLERALSQQAPEPAKAKPETEGSGDDAGGPPEGFAVQAGDAYRVGYDRQANTVPVRGQEEPQPITAAPLRTNQGKGETDPACAWCGQAIDKGEQYYDGWRGVKACLHCFPEGEPAEDGPDLPVPEEAEEAPSVLPGFGPSEAAEELKVKPPKTVSPEMMGVLLGAAKFGVGESAFIIKAERRWPGIEAVSEIPFEGFDEAMDLARGVG